MGVRVGDVKSRRGNAESIPVTDDSAAETVPSDDVSPSDRLPVRSPPSLSVVIPVFNEEENLPELYRRLRTVLDGIGRTSEIIFVDDGSRDRSAAMLREFAARDPSVVAVELVRNFGQHAAV